MNWEEKVRKVVPYVPGEQPKVEGRLIKLNTNEFPYPPSPKAKEALEKLEADRLRFYPDPAVSMLTKALAKKYKVSDDEVFVGVGSDDVLSVAFLTFFNSDKPVLFPDITYSFYDAWADVYRIPYETRPLDEDFHIVKKDYLCDNGGIVIANPNAPTGVSEASYINASAGIGGTFGSDASAGTEEASDISFFEDIVKANPGSVVIIDEAYVDFGGVSALPLVKKYDNVLVVQTFSKSRAFAGMRIGYAIGNKKLIKYMNDVKYSINSYTMNTTAILLGSAILEDEEYFKTTVQKVISTRERTKEELKSLGFTLTDSKTNFLFASHERVSAEVIFNELKKNNIYVRYFKKPRIDNHLRITIGTDEDMERFTECLGKIVG